MAFYFVLFTLFRIFANEYYIINKNTNEYEKDFLIGRSRHDGYSKCECTEGAP